MGENDSLNISRLVSRSDPITTYKEALEHLEFITQSENDKIDRSSRTRFISVGHKAERVVVWFHSYTSSPEQFIALGNLCFQKGYNVIIPRAPRHGLADHMTSELSQITAEELIHFADDVLDLAHGLGEKITIGGLSMGGVISAWLAQQRQDIDQAIIISPATGLKFLSPKLTRNFTRLILSIPNMFIWWDPRYREHREGQCHGYPRFSTWGLAQIFRLGIAIQLMAKNSKPNTHKIWMVINEGDQVVNNKINDQIAQNWKLNGGKKIVTYRFPVEMGLIHDLIEPHIPNQKIDLVYPVLLNIIEGLIN